MVFLGSGRYGGQPGPDFAKFVEASDFKGRKVALLGTCWMMGMGADREAAATTQALEKKGATVLGSYRCRGKAFVFNPGRPNKGDLEAAKKFAKKMVPLGG